MYLELVYLLNCRDINLSERMSSVSFILPQVTASSLGISPLVSPSSQPLAMDDAVTSSESSAESPGGRSRGMPMLSTSPTSTVPNPSSPAVVLSVSPVASVGVPSPPPGSASLSRQMGSLSVTGTI